MSRNHKFTRADHLANFSHASFQSNENQVGYSREPGERSRYRRAQRTGVKSFDKSQFLQANTCRFAALLCMDTSAIMLLSTHMHIFLPMCRFLISDVADTRALESNFDTLPDWGDVVLVRMSLPADYRCPISLDTLTLPYITPCGHVFSLISIVGHMMSRSPELRGVIPCPLCSVGIIAKDIRPVQRARYSSIEQGEVTKFCLLRRHKESNVLERIPRAGSQDATQEHPHHQPCCRDEFYPGVLDTFCKITLISNPENIWIYIVSKLTHECDMMRCEGESQEANMLVPIFLAATEFVLQHSRDWMERRSTLLQERQEELKQSDQEKSIVLDSDEIMRKLHDRIHVIEIKCQAKQESRLHQQAIDREFPSLVTQKDIPEDLESFSGDLDKFQVPVQHVRSMYGEWSVDSCWSMYQAFDGQFVFLSPFCMKILLCWRDKTGELPSEIDGQVLDTESIVQSEDTRKRYKPISFVPIGATFSICDVDLEGLVPRDVLDLFSAEIKQKQAKRIQQEKIRQRKLRREAKASAALAVQEKDVPPSAAELAAMPQLSPSGDEEVQRSFQSLSMRGESSFARIAQLGFAATGPALHENQSRQAGTSGTSPPSTSSVWAQSLSRVSSRDSDSQASHGLERGKKKEKKEKKVLFSAASQRQY